MSAFIRKERSEWRMKRMNETYERNKRALIIELQAKRVNSPLLLVNETRTTLLDVIVWPRSETKGITFMYYFILMYSHTRAFISNFK